MSRVANRNWKEAPLPRPVVDLGALQHTRVEREPFDYFIVPRFVRAEALDAIRADYPAISHAGSFPLSTLDYGPAFGAFMKDIQSADMSAAVGEKLAMELSQKPTMVTVRGQSREADGKIHTDSRTKLVTALIYMNDSWESPKGRLRLVRGPVDLNDVIAEVPPEQGTLLVFRNAPNAWHGFEAFSGPRRVIQLNWVTDAGVVRREQARHRLSAFFKRLGNAAHESDALMPLNIETFSNAVGGNAFYKAITHPLAAEPARALVGRLRASGAVAIYDPHNLLAGFDAFYPLDRVELAGLFVQDVSQIGRSFRNVGARPISELADHHAGTVLIAAFDAGVTTSQIKPLANGTEILTFDALRLPDDMLSDKARYLSNLNFATNFAFFRDCDGQHTRLVTINYWSGYGGKGGSIWFTLFDENGLPLAAWKEPLPGANGSIVVDSAELRARFALPAFTGQLFMHVVGAAGHDIVKYALDIYGEGPETLSCTHDANSWPADRYAGLPAPGDDEEVVLWVQNSHPNPIAPKEIGFNVMGDDKIAWLEEPVGAFATHRLSASELLPRARWPQQIEIRAGKHFVRPRYEVLRKNGRRRIAHPNVEREDLKLDERLPQLGAVLGKGFILPAPVLPVERFRSIVLPTPMSTAQDRLPVKLLIYDGAGNKAAEHSFGNLARGDCVALAANEILNGHIDGGYGHMELVYDFAAGQEADGWLHALFRYEDRDSGHAAETSFGAHMFNMLVTYKGEPQSYKGPPPGLSTRLFLRVGQGALDTLCHLIYPASKRWHDFSDTALMLMSGEGHEVARRTLRIACGGSALWRVNETFSEAERAEAGVQRYVVVRDATCRLFGYHGLIGDRAFSLDHMFGF